MQETKFLPNTSGKGLTVSELAESESQTREHHRERWSPECSERDKEGSQGRTSQGTTAGHLLVSKGQKKKNNLVTKKPKHTKH